MSKLFIFGNGFDLAHGYKTSYNDFRDWLCYHYNADENYIMQTPKYATNYKGLHEYDIAEMAAFFYSMIHDVHGVDWHEFETGLSKLDWRSQLDIVCDYYRIYENEYKYVYNNYEDEARVFTEFAFILPDHLFNDWVRDIDISSPSKISNEFLNLYNRESDHALSFNYTDTLEKHYNITDVCHIHGCVSKYEQIIVGHNSFYDYPDFDSDDDFAYIKHSCARNICERYKKNTTKAYKRKLTFFNSLTDITDIYIHGFSFSDVDLFYFKKIKQHLGQTNVAFHIHNYDDNDWRKCEEIVKSIGFNLNSINKFRFTDLNDVKRISVS